jgi:hypothetical protein
LNDELRDTKRVENDAEETTRLVRPVPTDALNALIVVLNEAEFVVSDVENELEYV